MKVLHITPHLGGGVGRVILDWVRLADGHTVICLDKINDKAAAYCRANKVPVARAHFFATVKAYIEDAEIVIVHYWDHPSLAKLFKHRIPSCRLIFWCHKNYKVPPREVVYPDLFIGTAPVQGFRHWIWSTGNMRRFQELDHRGHPGVNVGYIGTVDFKKMHRSFFNVCNSLPNDFRFIIVGENTIKDYIPLHNEFYFTGEVDDVTPYLKEMDILLYLLRPDHYGTCEQVLGEAMSAGVVPIVLDNQCESFIVEDCVSGVVADSLAECVQQVAMFGRFPFIRKGTAKQARIAAKLRYDLIGMITEWNRVFDKLMGRAKWYRGRMI